MRGYLIQHVVHITGTIMIESGIDGLAMTNTMRGIMRVLNPLQFVPLDKGTKEISNGVYPCLRSWLGRILTRMRPIDWF